METKVLPVNDEEPAGHEGGDVECKVEYIGLQLRINIGCEYWFGKHHHGEAS